MRDILPVCLKGENRIGAARYNDFNVFRAKDVPMNLSSSRFSARLAPRPFGALASIALVVTMALLMLPGTALADGYSMDHVNIDAQVAADGSLSVTEERSFSFDDDVNGVYWLIPLGQNQQGAQADVRIDAVYGLGLFTQVDSASKGDRGVYTVEHTLDGADDVLRLKVFDPHDDGESATITVHYTLTGAVMSWADTGELYWKFVGDGWSESSKNVTATISFASDLVAANPAKKGKTLRAWGHGPLTGNVSLDDSTGTVAYSISRVRSGEFAEARIAFPTAWVPQLAGSGEDRLPIILDEEKQWAEEANARREQARRVAFIGAVVTVAASAVFTVVVVVLKLRRRGPKPLFQDEYFRDVPSADHPATIATFMSSSDVPDQAFIASLMKLTDDRVLKLEQTTEVRKKLLGGQKTEETYRATVTSEAWNGVRDDIDRTVLETFFAGAKTGPDGSRSITFKQFKKYAKDHTKSFGEHLDDYKASVKASVEERNLVASSGAAAAVLGLVIGIILICIAVGALFVTDFARANVIAAFIAIPVIIVGMCVSFTFRRYTPEGAELAARCRALKHWLEDFTRLKEAVPGDLVLWNKLLVMGVALGVSREVLRELADAVPRDLRADDDFYYYYPGYWWYYHGYGDDSPFDAINEAYHASISELASSSDSSAGGGGGGFSGGGGGGVGGGGGGTF